MPKCVLYGVLFVISFAFVLTTIRIVVLLTKYKVVPSVSSIWIDYKSYLFYSLVFLFIVSALIVAFPFVVIAYVLFSLLLLGVYIGDGLA